MSLAIVSEAGVSVCRNGACRYTPGMSANDVLSQAKRMRLSAVLLAGLVSVDPWELAYVFRNRCGPNSLLIVILGSIGEISGANRPEEMYVPDLPVRPPSVHSEEKYTASSPRRLAVDCRGREIFLGNLRVTC